MILRSHDKQYIMRRHHILDYLVVPHNNNTIILMYFFIEKLKEVKMVIIKLKIYVTHPSLLLMVIQTLINL